MTLAEGKKAEVFFVFEIEYFVIKYTYDACLGRGEPDWPT